MFAGNDTQHGFPNSCGAFFSSLQRSFSVRRRVSRSGASGTEAVLGTGSLFGTRPMFTGDFDNTYFNSADPPTGNLYTCGKVGRQRSNLPNPDLQQHDGYSGRRANFTSGAATCSPITEAFNGTADLIFVNVQANGNLGSCGGGGCVMSFTVTGGTLPSGTAPTSSLAQNGGTSGVIIDTLGSATGGANQVYFTPLSTGAVCPSAAGCAIQASQSGLN